MATTSSTTRKDGTFRSLRVPNFRRFFVGQFLSQCGTWMEQAAVTWLVLGLTHSGVALGLVTTARLGPLLVLGPLGGLVADRVDRRRLMVITQSLLGILAVALTTLVLTDGVGVGAIYVLSIGVGLVMAVDNPTRRLLVAELVPADDLPNATGLSSALVTAAKTVGPALAGLVIAGPGVKWCFVLNAASYAVVVASLVSLDRWTIHASPVVGRAKGQLHEGFRYVRRTPELFVPLALVAAVGAFALNHAVTLPLLASRVLGGDAASFTWLLVSVSAGSVAGALTVARRRQIDVRFLVVAAGGAAVTTGALALVPSLPVAHAVLFTVGFTAALLVSGSSAAVQQVAEPPMRGRCTALFTTVFLGAGPVGGVAVGAVAEALGARAAVGLGALVAALATTWAAYRVFRVIDDEPATTPDELVRLLGGPDRVTVTLPGVVGDISDDDTLEMEESEPASDASPKMIPAALDTPPDGTPATDDDAPVVLALTVSTGGNGTGNGDGHSHEPVGNGGGPMGDVAPRPLRRAPGEDGWNRRHDGPRFTTGNGRPEVVLRDLRRNKAGLVRSRTKALQRLTTRANDTPDVAHLQTLPQEDMLHAMAELSPAADHPAAKACAALRSLAREVLELDDEITRLDLQIEPLSQV